jgi:hypothetical protein
VRQKCPRCGARPRDAKALLVHVSRCRKGGRPRLRGAKKEKRHGYTWDSGLERRLYELLLNFQRIGMIREVRVKPRVVLTAAKVICIPDFSYVRTSTGQVWYAEAKGFKTERWVIIRKLWPFYGPAPLEVYVAGRSGPELCETIYSVWAELA